MVKRTREEMKVLNMSAKSAVVHEVFIEEKTPVKPSHTKEGVKISEGESANSASGLLRYS